MHVQCLHHHSHTDRTLDSLNNVDHLSAAEQSQLSEYAMPMMAARRVFQLLRPHTQTRSIYEMEEEWQLTERNRWEIWRHKSARLLQWIGAGLYRVHHSELDRYTDNVTG